MSRFELSDLERIRYLDVFKDELVPEYTIFPGKKNQRRNAIDICGYDKTYFIYTIGIGYPLRLNTQHLKMIYATFSTVYDMLKFVENNVVNGTRPYGNFLA